MNILQAFKKNWTIVKRKLPIQIKVVQEIETQHPIFTTGLTNP